MNNLSEPIIASTINNTNIGANVQVIQARPKNFADHQLNNITNLNDSKRRNSLTDKQQQQHMETSTTENKKSSSKSMERLDAVDVINNKNRNDSNVNDVEMDTYEDDDEEEKNCENTPDDGNENER